MPSLRRAGLPGSFNLPEIIATLPGPIRGSLGREQGESTWDPLNASELAPNSANGLIPSLIAWAESQPAGNVATVSRITTFIVEDYILAFHALNGHCGIIRQPCRDPARSGEQVLPTDTSRGYDHAKVQPVWLHPVESDEVSRSRNVPSTRRRTGDTVVGRLVRQQSGSAKRRAQHGLGQAGAHRRPE